jgi:hypothetical protein
MTSKGLGRNFTFLARWAILAVKASHSQYLQKKYRIEFKAHTHVWA